MTSGRRSRVALALLLVSSLPGCGDDAAPPSVATLQAQLAGNHCRFEDEYDGCRKRGFRFLDLLLLSPHDCDLWAVKCLGAAKSPARTAALIDVLKTKADVETCDGVLPVRSTAVRLLGDSGDKSAIGPLRQLLASKPVMTLSSGASGCPARLEKLEPIMQALQKLER